MSVAPAAEAKITHAKVWLPDGTVLEFTADKILQFTPDGYLMIRGEQEGDLEHYVNLPMLVKTGVVRVARSSLVLPRS